MKNIANYLDEFIDDDLNECCNKKIKRDININKESMKAYKRGSREEEIENHGRPISYNKTFRDKTKYTRKNKHKNNY